MSNIYGKHAPKGNQEEKYGALTNGCLRLHFEMLVLENLEKRIFRYFGSLSKGIILEYYSF
jgi:hypothetical protein